MNLLPLSDFQQTVWRGQKLSPNSPLYNMVFTFDIYGALDENTFSEAFKILVQSSTNLRVVIDESDEYNPRQKDTIGIAQIPFIDLTTNLAFDLEAWMEENNKTNFDLTKKSYTTALIKLGEHHYKWYLNQHHIFTDAYCFQLLFNKISQIYQSLISGTEINIDNDFTTYVESLETAKTSSSDANTTIKNKRKNKFSIYGEDLTNFNKTASKRFYFSLEKNIIDAINKHLAKIKLKTFAANLDLLSYLISTLIITLAKVDKTDGQILLSSIFSNRFTKQSKQLAIPLLKILNKQFDFHNANSFAEIHQQVYAFLIMRQDGKAKDSSELSPAIVNFFELSFEDFATYKTEYKWHHCGHMDTHHSLRFHVFKYRKSQDFTFAFDIKEEGNTNHLANRLINDFKSVLTSLTNESQSIKNICLLPSEEINKINNKLNALVDHKIPVEEYFINVLKKQAQLHPNKVAIHFKNQKISYHQLMLRSRAYAEKIRNTSSAEDKKVIIYLSRSDNFIYAVLGSILSGSCFIPIPNNYPKERIQYIIENVDADIIIEDKKTIDTQLPKINIADIIFSEIHNVESETLSKVFYILYTSGSSGKPKGVPITHYSFSSYLQTVSEKYLIETSEYNMPLFTSVGFDLTMTSIFLPLFTSGAISIYEENEGIDMSIRDVITDKNINCIKCTPSHLKLIEDLDLSSSLQSVIVGGENFTKLAAQKLYAQANNNISIYNEYGPTECTVGCIVHKFDPDTYRYKTDVPIGIPLDDCFAFIVDQYGVILPKGVVGELCLSGPGLAKGYINDEILTDEKFIKDNPSIQGIYYKTGDLARINENNDFEYLGRNDAQIKINGFRVETSEIENIIESKINIDQCIVNYQKTARPISEYTHCESCGLPSNYPTGDFDDHNICGYCRNYKSYREKVQKYFQDESKFENIFSSNQDHGGEYDCIMLYSGGKDSTYALGKLVTMGLKVLAFTLDNGYISDNAKENITRVVDALKVDHVFGSTPAMNEIFVDSLKTHCNVCNGCFKTIYNLSLKIAFEKKIPVIVTGLSRGQFFETKLSEEIFWKPMEDVKEIEHTLFEARAAYHSVKDVVYHKTDGSFIEENQVLNHVKIVDFYRYHDVTLEALLNFINTKLPWIRPKDTGRSTNCTINKVGIYIHKQQKGYSNYAFPYSWDVRTGHKTKEETIDEIEEIIDEKEVLQIISEIGYNHTSSNGQLIAYYKGEVKNTQEIRTVLSNYLPDFMVPIKFINVDSFPLTENGKIDLKQLSSIEVKREKAIIAPKNEVEQLLLPIWKEVMEIKEISTDDNFFELGGTSLQAIRMVSRLEKTIQYKLAVNYIFEYPTIASLSDYIIADMQSILESNAN